MPMLHFDLDELFENLISEEKSKKQNSTDTKHIDKFGRVSREVPQAQQPQGFATLPNNSTDATVSTNLDVEKQHPSDKAPRELVDQPNDPLMVQNPNLLGHTRSVSVEEQPPQSRRTCKWSKGSHRIQTMWSKESGWCSWDERNQEYLPNPLLNGTPS